MWRGVARRQADKPRSAQDASGGASRERNRPVDDVAATHWARRVHRSCVCGPCCSALWRPLPRDADTEVYKNKRHQEQEKGEKEQGRETSQECEVTVTPKGGYCWERPQAEVQQQSRRRRTTAKEGRSARQRGKVMLCRPRGCCAVLLAVVAQGSRRGGQHSAEEKPAKR